MIERLKMMLRMATNDQDISDAQLRRLLFHAKQMLDRLSEASQQMESRTSQIVSRLASLSRTRDDFIFGTQQSMCEIEWDGSKPFVEKTSGSLTS